MIVFFEIVVISILIWLYALLSERSYYRRKLEQERERHRLHVAAIEAEHARQVRERVTTTLVRKPEHAPQWHPSKPPVPILIDDMNTDDVSTDRIIKPSYYRTSPRTST